MSEYAGIITKAALKVTRPDLLNKWISKHEGAWFKIDLKLVSKHPDPKSAAQLGLYWGLLVPAITKQLAADGHTITIEAFKNVTAERAYNIYDTHELLTSICNHVGKDGALMRLSDDDMTVARMRVVIDNVINFATQSLCMNGEKLRAWQDIETETVIKENES